jgi:hypothetical protein
MTYKLHNPIIHDQCGTRLTLISIISTIWDTSIDIDDDDGGGNSKNG